MQKKQNKNRALAQKPRISANERKIRRQQVIMAVIGITLILAMVIALAANY